MKISIQNRDFYFLFTFHTTVFVETTQGWKSAFRIEIFTFFFNFTQLSLLRQHKDENQHSESRFLLSFYISHNCLCWDNTRMKISIQNRDFYFLFTFHTTVFVETTQGWKSAFRIEIFTFFLHFTQLSLLRQHKDENQHSESRFLLSFYISHNCLCWDNTRMKISIQNRDFYFLFTFHTTVFVETTQGSKLAFRIEIFTFFLHFTQLSLLRQYKDQN